LKGAPLLNNRGIEGICYSYRADSPTETRDTDPLSIERDRTLPLGNGFDHLGMQDQTLLFQLTRTKQDQTLLSSSLQSLGPHLPIMVE